MQLSFNDRQTELETPLAPGAWEAQRQLPAHLHYGARCFSFHTHFTDTDALPKYILLPSLGGGLGVRMMFTAWPTAVSFVCI